MERIALHSQNVADFCRQFLGAQEIPRLSLRSVSRTERVVDDDILHARCIYQNTPLGCACSAW